MSEPAGEQNTTAVESLASGNETKERDINYYKELCLKLKDESEKKKIKQEKFDALFQEKTELEKRIKSYEDSIKKEQEQKLKENENYKALIELKEQEINKLIDEHEPTKKELEELRALKTQVEEKEKSKRESLLNEIKTISESQKNDSYLAIAEALVDNDKLELYLKTIEPQQVVKETKEILPVYTGKSTVNPKLAGEGNSQSLEYLQKLYKENRGLYNQIINNKRGN